MESGARVFVSCGQRTVGEKAAAKELAKILRERGYVPYVATDQVSLEGFKEAIFPQLADAEYLLFVDFPREKITARECRGSLFSHQELAIAAFLELPYIGFRHKSVRREGISDFLLSNVPTFETEMQLPSMLRRELRRRRDWTPGWRKKLIVERPDPDEGDDMMTSVAPNRIEPVRFFHLTVRNLHRDRMAISCTAYVEQIRDAKTGEEIAFRASEIKWSGTQLPSVPITPGGKRDLDACFMLRVQPNVIHFASTSDSGHHMSPIANRAIHVGFLIVSENFPPARCTVSIEPGNSLDGVGVYVIS